MLQLSTDTLAAPSHAAVGAVPAPTLSGREVSFISVRMGLESPILIEMNESQSDFTCTRKRVFQPGRELGKAHSNNRLYRGKHWLS